jgi:exodeoxyribonuclease VII large subunit
MAKPVKTQWDFGDLFSQQKIKHEQPAPTVQPPSVAQPPSTPELVAPPRKIWSVTDLTWQIRQLLEQQVGQIWVTGQVTNLRAQNSGHIYFTLKDTNAQLSCVLFRGEVQVDRALLQDGRKVTVQGDVTVYETRGQYQLRVTGVELEGIGALQVAFERLKQKLKAEGLFATARKRPLPRYPQRIGLVTSPTGAAIRDVLHVIERRNPALKIILAPCRVQGEGAGLEIADALKLLNEFSSSRGNEAPISISRRSPAQGQSLVTSAATGPYLDLILLTRGGGSLEDLWAFNEEVVARAIFESALPVVSAVGHEIDFTISDFVADVRAATPSAAAEIITEGVFSSCQFISEVAVRIQQLARQRLGDKAYELAQTNQRLIRVHPRRRLNDWLQRLDDLQIGLLRCVKQGARQQRLAWRNLSERLSRVRPRLLLKQRRDLLRQETERLREQARHHVQRRRDQLSSVEGRLRLLGPEQVLARAYSITTEAETGKVLRDAREVKAGQRLKTRLKNGELRSVVEE